MAQNCSLAVQYEPVLLHCQNKVAYCHELLYLESKGKVGVHEHAFTNIHRASHAGLADTCIPKFLHFRCHCNVDPSLSAAVLLLQKYYQFYRVDRKNIQTGRSSSQ